MGRVYYRQRVEGVTIPAVIHNGSYFYTNLGVYENGIVSCWRRSDLRQFKEELARGWVTPCIPIGRNISIYGLGEFPVLDAHWKYDNKGFYQYIEKTVKSLNPEMKNIYQTTQGEIDKWAKVRVRTTAEPISYKVKPGFGYVTFDGKTSNIFYRKKDQIYLTTITAYADKTLEIDAEPDRIFELAEINEMFEQGIFTISIQKEEWVIIEGLGRVLLGETKQRYKLPKKEKQKEIQELVCRVAGEKDAHDKCIWAHYAYLTDPSEFNREALRKAYEAVPEHERMYLGDMDTKDSDIIRILKYPDEKREV